jgi:putative membrane protein
MRRTLPHLIAGLLIATAPLALYAQEKDVSGGTPTDAFFFKNAGQSNLDEIELSKIAAERASSPKVKAFAQKMVAEHTRANEELQDLKDGDKSYPRATQPRPEADKQADALERMSGKEFDQAYIKIMIADHETAVAQMEAEIEKGTNDKMKAYARKMLPKIKAHLAEAKGLR